MASSSQSQPVSALLGADCEALSVEAAGRRIDGGIVVGRIKRAITAGEGSYELSASDAKKLIAGWAALTAAVGLLYDIQEIVHPLADGPKGQDGPDHSPGMNPDLPTPTQRGSDT